jgi:O-antigen/teichoic acid export membrane protein
MVTSDANTSSWKADGLVSGVALLLLLTVVQRAAGFFRNVMVCRWLEPEQLGYWNLANSFLILAAPLVVLGIPGSFVRYLEHYRQRGRLHSFLRRTLVATGILAVAGVIALAVNREFAAWLTFGHSGASTLLVTCAATLLFVIGFNVCVELLTALRQVKIVSYLQFGNSLLFTLVALTLVGITGLSALGVVIGYAVACLITSVVAAVVIWR